MARGCLAAMIAAAVVFCLPARAQDDAARLIEELTSNQGPIGIDFTLTDPAGRKRSLAEFRGKVVVIYFGYTFCPDVCPTDLAQIARALRYLGPRGADVQALFITLDPERDTPKLLRNYTRAFHPRLLALRGSEAETRRIARAFKVFYERVDPPGAGYYLINHAAYTFLIDRGGRYAGFIPPGTPSGRISVMISEVAAGASP